MKKVFLLVTAFLFVQCIPGGGYWRYPVKNTSDREVIFGIDVNVVNGKIYPRDLMTSHRMSSLILHADFTLSGSITIRLYQNVKKTIRKRSGVYNYWRYGIRICY